MTYEIVIGSNLQIATVLFDMTKFSIILLLLSLFLPFFPISLSLSLARLLTRLYLMASNNISITCIYPRHKFSIETQLSIIVTFTYYKNRRIRNGSIRKNASFISLSHFLKFFQLCFSCFTHFLFLVVLSSRFHFGPTFEELLKMRSNGHKKQEEEGYRERSRVIFHSRFLFFSLSFSLSLSLKKWKSSKGTGIRELTFLFSFFFLFIL